jgi:enterochelin esterase-like enzyme
MMILFVAVVAALTGCGKSAEAPAAKENEPSLEMLTLSVQITVPEETPTVYMTGNLPELGPWDPAALTMTGEDRTRQVTLEVPAGHALEYKFTLGRWAREAADFTGSALPNFQLTVTEDTNISHDIAMFKLEPEKYMEDWQGSGVKGTLVYWQDVSSAFLNQTRHVEIWLPPGYEENTDKQYPVIYMSDGQNLFDPRIANTGTDWGIDEAMMAGVDAGLYKPAIVVGAWSSDDRFIEYSPWHNAKDYAQFLVEELMPRVNAEFRTLQGPENTYHMGSSMGGLLSYYLVKEHPEVFSACGCVSSHFPLSDRVLAGFTGGDVENADPTPWIEKDIAAGQTIPAGQRFFFDYGTEGLDAEYAPMHDAVREWFIAQGYTEGQDFLVREYEGADHNEASWRARIGDQIGWLLAGSVPE